MKKYTIAIEETVVKAFEVCATGIKDVMKLAERKYKNDEFILDPGEVQFKQMRVTKPENEATEWRYRTQISIYIKQKTLSCSQGLLRLSKDSIYFPDSCFSAISTNFLVI